MTFGEIAEIGIVKYVERQRASNSLWGFVHVPKTAGTSLSADLEKYCTPFHRILPKSYMVTPEEFRASEWEAVRRFVELQRSPADGNAFRSFSGHIKRRHTDFICAELPGVRLFTFLRDPVSRVISDYRYCLTPAHPPHEEFARRYPTLLDYVRDPRNQNNMIAYLAPVLRTTADVAIESITTHFAFLGVSEMYQLSATAIFRMMGLVHVPQERLNVTPTTERNSFEVDADVAEQIRQLNHLDEAIYQYAHKVLVAQDAVWWQHFNALQGNQPVL